MSPVLPRLHRGALVALLIAAFIAASTTVAVAAARGGSASNGELASSIVHTQLGTVQGVVDVGHREFLDIPYAAPPVGDLRWEPPAPAAPWSGTRDATKFGQQCPQNPNPLEEPGWSEDCLHLNVWTPSAANERHLPVIVWMHGGAHDHSSGRIFDAERMSEQGNAIVVTINYRLGVFGYLAHPGLDAASPAGSGEYGLMDEVAALRWVRSNIGAFGGDAHRVTVDGDSSGATDSCDLLASPHAAGLFSGAIVESASCAATDRASGYTQGEAYATAAGCPDASTAVACLRGKSTADLLTAELHRSWGPVDGASYLPQAPQDAIAAGHYNHVPVIKGATHDEGRFTLRSTTLTADGYVKKLQSTYGANADTVLTHYPVASYASPVLAFATVTSDQSACETRQEDAVLSKSPPLYPYEFDDPNAPNYPGLVTTTLPQGPTHGSELAYLFDVSGIQAPFDAGQRELAAEMIRYWTTFAATGRPAPAGVPAMPRYNPAGDQFLSLRPGGNQVITDYATDHQCALWDPIAG